jgi:hypothetical protein
MINLPKIELKSDSIEKVNLDKILSYLVLPSDEIPKPDPVLYFGEQMVMTRQNISCVTGKAKVGKTFLMTLINQAILQKGEHNILRSYLPKGKDKIIYIDTEQSKYHISLILQRIKKVVSDEKLKNILMFNFDALSTNERRSYVEQLVYTIDGVGVVIIDGIADLIYDTNDIRESADMADSLRKWATQRDLHIINVLHQNPSDNQKMRGHLGTILTNKSETVIQISSSKENESIKLVESLATRNKKPENWSFEIIEGQPTIMDTTYTAPVAGRKIKKLWQNYERYAILIQAFTGVNKAQGIGYSVLLEKVRENVSEMGENAIKEFIRYAKEMKWICQDIPKGAYFLHDFIE